MHEIKFPAHTQARMDAAKAAKNAKTAKPATFAPLPLLQQHNTPNLRGYVEGLDLNARRTILETQVCTTIAYGGLESPAILHEKVNVTLLRHYIPKIIDDYYVATTESDYMVLLPTDMRLVTERGLKHVIHCMLREIQQGSYRGKGINGERNARYMIRPHFNVVNNIHALNTLRAFGLDHDADFLGRKDGPIAIGLKLRAQQWTGGIAGLGCFLETMDRDLLEGQDKELLSEAWAVYNESRHGNAPSIARQSNA